MHELLEKIGALGIVPVIRLETADRAVGLGRALLAGGIPVAEITFRSAAAAESIRRLRSELPDLLVGAGTVLSLAQAEEARAAGASFIVSPGFDEAVVDFCLEVGLPVLPGVTGPDGVLRGLAKGLEVLKFFPAEASGGLPMMDALAGPFAAMRFVPTGGIDATSLDSWARRPNVLAVGGSWMVPAALVETEDWAGIEALCRGSVRALHGFSFAHVGLNSEDEKSARAAVGLLSELFGLVGREGSSSFMYEGIEVTKTPFLGAKGHIGLRCNDVKRALARLSSLGVGTLPGSEKIEKGRLKAVYLDRELLGFAIHLLQA